MNEVAEKTPEFRISYHNHAFEFDTDIDGKSALEYLLEPTSDNKIFAEIDVFWVKRLEKIRCNFLNPMQIECQSFI
ncbi:hypothetical protein AAHB53_05785 [Niallia circulans]